MEIDTEQLNKERIEKAITEYFGEQCPDYCKGCVQCMVWEYWYSLLARKAKEKNDKMKIQTIKELKQVLKGKEKE